MNPLYCFSEAGKDKTEKSKIKFVSRKLINSYIKVIEQLYTFEGLGPVVRKVDNLSSG